jgi:methyl-accepting chemotaxis protein
MSLTKDDLAAIQQIVHATVRPMIDELAQDTALGFEEVHGRIDSLQTSQDDMRADLDGVKTGLSEVMTDLSEVKADLSDIKSTVNRIENIQRSEVSRVDEHARAITIVNKKLSIA